MKYDTLFNTLQNLMKFKPKVSDIANILGVSNKALYARAQRNVGFSDDEIQKIEEFYAVDLTGGINIDCIEIDYYPEVFGSCGAGVFVPSEIKEKMFVPKNSFMSFSPVKHYSVINAIGESMLPFIHDKDKLIVEHFEDEQIKDNKIYVFCYNDEIFVKRLIKNVKELIIKSDNPDPMYRPIIIEKEEMNEVRIIGQIVGIVREVR